MPGKEKVELQGITDPPNVNGQGTEERQGTTPPPTQQETTPPPPSKEPTDSFIPPKK